MLMDRQLQTVNFTRADKILVTPNLVHVLNPFQASPCSHGRQHDKKHSTFGIRHTLAILDECHAFQLFCAMHYFS
jgi:hypothetical protein